MGQATAQRPAAATSTPAAPTIEPVELRITRHAVEQLGAERSLAELRRWQTEIAHSLDGKGPHSQLPFVMRQTFRAERQLVLARIGLVERLSAGDQVLDWTATWTAIVAKARLQVATETIAEGVFPTSAAETIARLAGYVRADAGELLALGDHEYDPFRPAGRARLERVIALETRLPARAAASEGFGPEFSRRSASFIKARRGEIETPLFEWGILLGQHAAASVGGMRQELAHVQEQLAALADVASENIVPGAMTANLQLRAAELQARIKSALAGHASAYEADVRGALDDAASGNVAAWGALYGRCLKAFEAFADDNVIVALGRLAAEAMIAVDPMVFAASVVAQHPESQGRETL